METKYAERIRLVEDAVALKEPERIPVCPFFSAVAPRLFGSCYRDLYYDHDRAGEAILKFYEKYQPDASMFSGFTSGRSNELAGSTMIDWPGRPGTRISVHSSHQVLEREYMTAEEYPELFSDYTGFMLRKYIPRAFPGLKALGAVNFRFATILNTAVLDRFATPETAAAWETLNEIGRLDRETAAKSAEYRGKLTEMGFPPFFSCAAEAPYDILGDYFRGTMGIFEDLIEREEDIARACDLFAEHQIENLRFLETVQMPVKRVFFPLHKGMDGFIGPDQFYRLYWKPLMKVTEYLVSIGVTPYLYTEGKYDTRLEILKELPKGKYMVHIDNSDIAAAKRALSGIACITGNLPIAMLEFGKKEQVTDYCKYLIDTCAPGGGYIFDTDGSLENAKEENLDAMFETLAVYGGR